MYPSQNASEVKSIFGRFGTVGGWRMMRQMWRGKEREGNDMQKWFSVCDYKPPGCCGEILRLGGPAGRPAAFSHV